MSKRRLFRRRTTWGVVKGNGYIFVTAVALFATFYLWEGYSSAERPRPSPAELAAADAITAPPSDDALTIDEVPPPPAPADTDEATEQQQAPPPAAAAPAPRVAMIDEEPMPMPKPTPATLRVPVPPAPVSQPAPALPEATSLPLVSEQPLASHAAEAAPAPTARPVHSAKPLMARVAAALARVAKEKPIVTEPVHTPHLAVTAPAVEQPRRAPRPAKLVDDRRAARLQQARETHETRHQTHVVAATRAVEPKKPSAKPVNLAELDPFDCRVRKNVQPCFHFPHKAE